MIPQDFITEWSNYLPWKTNEQVEQDLVICRSLVEIFSDDFLSSNLAFRGGTTLNKIYLQPPARYSEDIDLVQINPHPIKETIQRLQDKLRFIDPSPVIDPRKNNNTLKFRFQSEFPPVQILRLKIEINCREHFSVLGYQVLPFTIKTAWFSGSCEITTYKLEELLGTKIRALYQRRKGRDLYDLYKAIKMLPDLNLDEIIQCYRAYMKFVVDRLPTQNQYLRNLEEKLLDTEFLGDTTALIHPDEEYNPHEAFELVKARLIERL